MNSKRASLQFGIVAAAWLLCTTPAPAELPEPPNVVHGTIVLDNVPVTAARTDVVVEARRTTNGAPIAAYRMGANARFGNFYGLEIRMETLSPVRDAAASQAGEGVVLVVRDASGVRGVVPYTMGERGQVQRLDFGTAAPDSDGDNLPDAWELFYFGNLARTGSFVSPNGLTALQNFIAGTDPLSTNNLFALNITLTNNQKFISFPALRAEGPGYEGRTRLYAVETVTNLVMAPWMGAPNWTNLLGANQILILPLTGTNSPAMYRGRVWLQGP